MAVWLSAGSNRPAEAVAFAVDHLGDDSGQACTSTANDCSLRSAIEQANANAVADTITFGSLSGTISLGSALPALSAAQATTIDGNGTVTISGAGGGFDCFTVTSAGNTIRDLSITGCLSAIHLSAATADSNAIKGNTIFGNLTGITIVAGANGNTVGGTTTADRNVIRNNTGFAVTIASAGNSVTGNCIGTQADCITGAPNGLAGVQITGAGATDNTVGGTAAGAGNTIAFNAVGVDMAAAPVPGNDIVTRNVMFLNTIAGILSGAPPTIGCADAGGGSVVCSGTAAAAGMTIEVYRANVHGGVTEGDLFLCTAVSGGSNAWGCTFPNPGGGSATATQRAAGGNTSAFAPAAGIPAGPVVTATPTPTNTPSVTNTPTITPTVTGTPPTSTPTKTVTPGGPTATATVGAMESITLVGGTCNPVASTYPDNTPITTIANAVSPSGILISIWWFNPGTASWLGYSPQFPQASDLTSVDRLEAIFICVSSAGAWSRPIV
jgi:hypothetical protein